MFAVLAADGEVSESFARTICVWTDKLPAGLRDAADGILIGAALSGLDLRDLAVLASEMLARAWQPDRQDPARGPEDQNGQPRDHPDREPGEPAGDGAEGERPGAGAGTVAVKIRTASPATARPAVRTEIRTASLMTSAATGHRMSFSRTVR